MSNINIRLNIVRFFIIAAFAMPIVNPSNESWHIVTWLGLAVAGITLPHNVKKEDFE